MSDQAPKNKVTALFILFSSHCKQNMILEISLFINFVVLPVAFVIIEAICIVGKTERKPSTVILVVADMLRTKAFYYLAYVPALMADVFGFFRKVVFWIRDTFFGWIPKEALLEAMRNLRRAMAALLKSPLGLLEGLWAALAQSTLPLLSSLFFLVGTGVTVLSWEAIFFYYGIRWRPSALLTWVGLSLYNVFYTSVASVYHLTHIGGMIKAIVRYCFGWIPLDILQQGAADLGSGGYTLATSVAGLRDGWFFLEDKMGSFGLVLFVPLLVFVVYKSLGWCGPKLKAWVDDAQGYAAAALPADNGSGDDDDDRPPAKRRVLLRRRDD